MRKGSSATKVCQRCGSVFRRNGHYSRAQWAASKFCSRSCSGAAIGSARNDDLPPMREAFEALFAKSDGCWEWKGTIEGGGYGVLDYAGRRYRAHVLAIQFSGRSIAEGLVARHNCDNPRCVRADHLEVGTPEDNVHDAMRRDRVAYGVRSPKAKLSDAAVREMRAIEGQSYASIARRLGVSRPTATRAIRGETWRRVQ